MLLTRRAPDHVTRPNFLDRASPTLYQAAARCHDQGLAQRMDVPGCPGSRLECDTHAECACRIGCLEQRVNTYTPSKILVRSFAGRLGATSFDVHFLNSFT